MVDILIPTEIVLLLLLLPGYVAIRTGFYAARYIGPVDWPEYEKTAWSLIGSILIVSGLSVVFPRIVTIGTSDAGLRITVDFDFGNYIAVLFISVFVGAVLGTIFVELLEVITDVTPRRLRPQMYLMRYMEEPRPARISTADREITGIVRYYDSEGSVAVIQYPSIVTEKEGSEYREKRGEYAYINPETIENVYYGSRFRPYEENTLKRVMKRVLPSVANEVGRGGSTGTSLVPPNERISITDERLIHADNRVCVQGIVHNKGSRELSYVHVRIHFKNKEGEIVGDGLAARVWFQEGDFWRFSVEYVTNKPNEISDFSYRLYSDYV